ncbi:endoglucanase-like [Prunus yedoensis var. nudiflora]|uniref:Endoglucanase n=1 Tax=Prunus yedoensis var. nudiflora TaxID=2094558 RepID=A0A314XRW4_PRUYE|nr:endoglucanase-like [Prunus yedoensis var. nudiflora]
MDGLALAMEDEIEGLSSPLAANYDYGDALGKAILFFEGQRSGKLPTNQRVTWRGDSACSDGTPENVNLVGGYYDAGDNVKFGWPMAFSVSLLSWAAVEYQQQISSSNQLAYLQKAIRWGTDFILKAHTSPTTFYTQVGDGNADHQCWERPEDMDTPRTLYKITSSSPGSEPAAEAAAALASASIVFKVANTNYSATLLRHSKSTSTELLTKAIAPFTALTPAIRMSCYGRRLGYTGKWRHQVLELCVDKPRVEPAVNEFSWDNKFPGVQTLLAKEFHCGKTNLAKFKTDAESFVCALMPGSSSVQIRTTPGGLLFTRDSSNLQYVTSSTLVLFIYSKTLTAAQIGGVQCGSAFFSASQIRAFAKTQVDYILGKNPKNMSYMVGFGAKYPTQLHHRGSSIPSMKVHPTKVDCNGGYSGYYSSPNPNPNTHVGAVVGGPDVNDQFSDARSDYSHSEPTTYMNAAFVGAVAALVGQCNAVSL